MKLFAKIVALLAVAMCLTGCSQSNPTAEKFSRLAKVFPHQVIFNNNYPQIKGEDDPENAWVNTEVMVSIVKVDEFVGDIVCPLYDSLTAAELDLQVQHGFEGLGFYLDTALVKIPDGLKPEFQAWIVAAAQLAYQARSSANAIDSLAPSQDYDYSMGSSRGDFKPGREEQTVPNPYGEVKLTKRYDYEGFPKPKTGVIITE